MSGKDRDSKGGEDISRMVLWRYMNKSELSIFSHCTVVTAVHMGIFHTACTCTAYEGEPDSRDDAHPSLDT